MSRIDTLSIDPVEFTYEWYRDLLEQLIDHGYETVSFEDDPGDGDLLLRHDVDLLPRKALEMGRIEARLGLQSTYFFLVSNPLYNVFDASCRTVLAELNAMGHEVGVHFSTHQYWSQQPPTAELLERINAERSALSIAADDVCEPVSFHCPPEWAIDRAFDGFTSTYEPRFFSDATYVADSGQRWRREHPFDGQPSAGVQLLTHPGLWGDSDHPYPERVMSGIAENLEFTERFLTGQLLEGEFEPPVRLAGNGAAADR